MKRNCRWVEKFCRLVGSAIGVIDGRGREHALDADRRPANALPAVSVGLSHLHAEYSYRKELVSFHSHKLFC